MALAVYTIYSPNSVDRIWTMFHTFITDEILHVPGPKRKQSNMIQPSMLHFSSIRLSVPRFRSSMHRMVQSIGTHVMSVGGACTETLAHVNRFIDIPRNELRLVIRIVQRITVIIIDAAVNAFWCTSACKHTPMITYNNSDVEYRAFYYSPGLLLLGGYSS